MSKMEIPSVDSAKSALSQANGSLANGSLANGSLVNGHAKSNGSAIAPGKNTNGPVTRSRKA